MLHKNFKIDLGYLLNNNINRAQGLLEEVELLSENKIVKRALRDALMKDKRLSNDDLLSIVQNANEELWNSKDKITKNIINFTNFIALKSMNEFGLDENEDQFVLTPTTNYSHLEKDFLGSFSEWDDETNTYKDIYFVKQDYLPKYVEDLWTEKNNFKPLFDYYSNRLNLSKQHNFVKLRFFGNQSIFRIKNYFEQKISGTKKDFLKGKDPAYYSLKFEGDFIKGHSMMVDHHSIKYSEPRFLYPDDVKLLSFEDDSLKIFYYPITMNSSGVNNRELFFRPPAMGLWLLSQIPGIYYGKK
jgi:hypothetical protein